MGVNWFTLIITLASRVEKSTKRESPEEILCERWVLCVFLSSLNEE